MRFERRAAWAVAGLAVLCLSCGNENDKKPTGPAEIPPRSPIDLEVLQTAETAITLRWRDTSENEIGFRIERSVGNAGAFAKRDTVPRDVTTYADANVQPNEVYYYRVRSYSRAVASDPTAVVWGRAVNNQPPTVPGTPDPPDRSSGIEEGIVTLRWEASDPDPDDNLTYTVYFGQARNAMDLVAPEITETSFVVSTPVSLNAAYFWRVIVRDRNGAMRIGPVWAFNTRVERVEVPAGWLVMGDDGDDAIFPHPGNPIWVDAFEMDRYEVTNQQYAVFLNEAIRRNPPLIRISGGEVYDIGGQVLLAQTWEKDDDSQIIYDRTDQLFTVVAGRENFPVIEVTWQGASAFATYYNRRLPAEAEWEMAARGNEDERGVRNFTITLPDSSDTTIAVGLGRTYPWGSETAGAYANFLGSGDPFEGQTRVQTTPVGFFDGGSRGGFQTRDGASVFGIHDMAGNVAEWCADWYAPYHAPHAPPASGTLRIIRGGSWIKGVGSLQTWRRDYARPFTPGDDSGADRAIGFRTVRSIP